MGDGRDRLGEVDAAIEAIEAQDRAFAAQAASKAPSPAAAGRDAERWSALTPKERTAGPEALPGLRAKHDKNIARRAKEREFRQWSKARMATEPARFEALSSQERRAEFRQWKAEEADHAQDHAVPAKIEAQEFEEAGPEPD